MWASQVAWACVWAGAGGVGVRMGRSGGAGMCVGRPGVDSHVGIATHTACRNIRLAGRGRVGQACLCRGYKIGF